MRWIRREFLAYEGRLEKMVVHGHSVSTSVQELPHRIGIDTGAYRTGNLTALGLEGTTLWYLSTNPNGGGERA